MYGRLKTNQPEKPNHNMKVVARMHLSDEVQYRLVWPDAGVVPQAQTTQPGLEDGYVWLMKGWCQDVNGE